MDFAKTIINTLGTFIQKKWERCKSLTTISFIDTLELYYFKDGSYVVFFSSARNKNHFQIPYAYIYLNFTYFQIENFMTHLRDAKMQMTKAIKYNNLDRVKCGM